MYARITPGACSLTWLMASHSLYLRKDKIMWFIPHSKTPGQAHRQNALIHICISSGKQNSKSFQTISVPLGGYKLAAWGKEVLSSPPKLTQEVTGKVCSQRPAALTTAAPGKDHPGNGAVRAFNRLLLTRPQSSQPQTTKACLRTAV